MIKNIAIGPGCFVLYFGTAYLVNGWQVHRMTCQSIMAEYNRQDVPCNRDEDLKACQMQGLLAAEYDSNHCR